MGSSQQPTGGGGAGGVASTTSTGGGVTQDMLQQMLSQIVPPTTQSVTQSQPAAGIYGDYSTDRTLSPLTSPGGQGVAAPPSGGQPAAVLTQQQQQAEVLYQSQLEQLANMGFPDRQRNILGQSRLEGWACVQLTVSPSHSSHRDRRGP